MEMEEEGKSVKDYLQMARRRKYFIVIPMMLGFIISVLIAFILPPVYRSEAIILIEQQHIPTDVVKSTVVSFADERIQQIQQKIMTIESINKMINQFDLYPKEKNKLTARELALLFRQSAKLELISADVIEKGKKSKIILAFKLIFEHKQAALAQQVANELLTRFLV
ncbi:MAG: Wzz/FepE/Etk N-terminal domain-containing protein, partial [Methylococcales bacterium]